jgi:hypothetical protein
MHSRKEHRYDFCTPKSDLVLHSMPLRVNGVRLETTTRDSHALVRYTASGNTWPHPNLITAQGSKGWTVPTMALAMVTIALATLVAGGITTWHYWNEEKRAAQGEQQAARQRYLDWWKGEMQRAEANRQQYRELEQARVKTRSGALVVTIGTGQEQEATECRAVSADLGMRSRTSTAVFDVPDPGHPDR